ncbi:hypothetical protein [Flavobacterium sp.]|uniref:hypothetical protein n=1 Tax=Flavobacterium sp. TaxID=239 RepID=UPI0040478E6C
MRLLNQITYPKIKTILLFSIFSFLFLVSYVWNFSFSWAFIFGVNDYIIFLLFTLFIGSIITFLIDKKHKTKLKIYCIIPLFQLLIISLVANPIRTWQIEKSKNETVYISELIENYKIQYKNYPNSLQELEIKTKIDIPRRNFIGTKYKYVISENGNFSLYFKSYYGYDYHYNPKKNEWITND